MKFDEIRKLVVQDINKIPVYLGSMKKFVHESEEAFKKGEESFKKGNIDKAIHEFKSAIYKHDHATPHFYLGHAYLQQGNLENAIKEYIIFLCRLPPSEAFRFEPGFNALNNIVGIYIQQGLMDEAENALNWAISIDPNFAWTHNQLGHFYQEKNLLNNAIDEYKEAIRLNPNDADSHYWLGAIYHNQGRKEDAVSEYKIASQLGSEDAKSMLA